MAGQSRLTRRRALAGVGTALSASVTGCLLDQSGGRTRVGAAVDWLGPEVAGTDDDDSGPAPLGKVSVSVPETLASRLPDDVADFVSGPPVFESGEWLFSVDRESTDRVIRGGFSHPLVILNVYEGSHDPEAVRASLPDDAERRDTYRGIPVFAAGQVPGNDPWYAVGIGTDAVVSVGTERNQGAAVDLLRTALDTHHGDAPRYIDTDERYARFAEVAGEGFLVTASPLGGGRTRGFRLQLDGEYVDRRVVYVFSDRESAREQRDSLQEVIDEALDQAGEGDDRTPWNKYANYEDIDVRRDGNEVRFDAMIPVEELHVFDFSMLA